MIKDLVNELIDFEAKDSDYYFTSTVNYINERTGITGQGTTNLLEEYAHIYGKVRAHKALLKAVYMVRIDNIFGHQGDIPWFNDSSLCYLATDASLSLGSAESESFYAGSVQANYLTQKSSDETEITFIETANGAIAKSYKACYELAFNRDGTVNEPKKYAFKLTVAILNPKNPNQIALQGSWLVGVKSASADVSASSRSEVVEIPITFQKLRPLSFSS